jgi:hypothetical protein
VTRRGICEREALRGAFPALRCHRTFGRRSKTPSMVSTGAPQGHPYMTEEEERFVKVAAYKPCLVRNYRVVKLLGD